MGEPEKLNEDLHRISIWVNNNRRDEGVNMPDLPVSQAEAIYDLLKKKVDEKLWTSEVTIYWIRLSIEFIHSMLFGEYELQMDALITRTKSGLGEYLKWKESAFGKAVDKLGKTIVDEWLLSRYSSTAKKLVEKAEGGNLRATDLLFKTVGKAEGAPGGSLQPFVQLVKSYGMFDEKGNPAEVKMNIVIPVEPKKNLLEGTDGKTI